MSKTKIPSAHGEAEIRGEAVPTEENEGYTGDTYCTSCGDVLEYGSIIPKLDHSHTMNKTEAKSPTCKEDGNIEYYTCTVCGGVYTDVGGTKAAERVTIPSVHIGGTEIRGAKAPSEEQEGYTGDVYCLGCGEKLLYGTAIPKLDHSHSMKKSEYKAPTCKEDGNVEYYTCTSCYGIYYDEDGINKINSIEETKLPKGHKGGTEVKNEKSPTEDEEGYTGDVYCLGCGEILASGSTVSRLPHTHSIRMVERNEPTCTDDGNSEYYVCDSCKKLYSDAKATSEISLSDVILSKSGHSMTHFDKKAPDCENSGSKEYWHCEACDKIYLDVDGALPTDDVTLPALSHELKHFAYKAPDCFTDGNAEYYHCSHCKKSFSDAEAKTPVVNTLIPASHSFTYHAKVLPDCTSEGVLEHWSCSACKNNYADESGESLLDSLIITPSGHSYEDGVCSSCGDLKIAKLLYDIVGDGSVVITGVDSPDAVSLIIPSEYDGFSVVGIEAYAFAGLTALKSVKIESGVGYIGEYAFSGCEALAELKLPNGLTEIREGTFKNCLSLVKVEIPNGINVINEYAFSGCKGLVSVSLPRTLSLISAGAFSFCPKLVEVINNSKIALDVGLVGPGSVSSSAKEIHNGESKIMFLGDFVFYTYEDVSYLLGYVGDESALTLPYDYRGGRYSVYEYAFSNLKSLEEITFTGGVFEIGKAVLKGCSLLQRVELPSGIKEIPDSAFENCSKLAEIEIPSSVTKIGEYSFFGCASLKEVLIPDEVSSIGQRAFNSCTSLSSVTLGESVKQIYSEAFGGCTALFEVINRSSLTLTPGSTKHGEVARYAKTVKNSTE